MGVIPTAFLAAPKAEAYLPVGGKLFPYSLESTLFGKRGTRALIGFGRDRDMAKNIGCAHLDAADFIVGYRTEGLVLW